ncbi:MAG: hypothetical protein J6Y58_07700 [Clostridiales bacterium]|nr:hypothetical protein [Clostridiales bacterium]
MGYIILNKGKRLDMKRFASILTVLVLILMVPMSFGACKKTEGKNEEQLETTGSNEIPEPENQETSIEVTEIQSGTIGPHEIPESEYQEISIKDTEVLNREGVSIHILGGSLGKGPTRVLKMRVVNNYIGNQDIQLKVEKLVVDGFSDTPLWERIYEMGTTTESEFEFNTNLGNSIGIRNPGKIDIKFKVLFMSNGISYYPDVTLYTSSYDASKTYDLPYAFTFYDKNDVKMSVLNYEYFSSGDAELQFLFENITEDGITISTDHSEDSLVNGIPVYLNVYSMLDPGEKTVYSTHIYKNDLENAKITKVDTISMTLYYKKDSNYKNKIKCNPFEISVQ